MNGLNHHCVFLPHSEYAVEEVLRDFSYSKNGTINTQMLSEAIGVSTRTIKRELYILRDMHLIKYVGSNKTGHW